MKAQKKSLVTVHVMLIAITALFLATNCAPKAKAQKAQDVQASLYMSTQAANMSTSTQAAN